MVNILFVDETVLVSLIYEATSYWSLSLNSETRSYKRTSKYMLKSFLFAGEIAISSSLFGRTVSNVRDIRVLFHL